MSEYKIGISICMTYAIIPYIHTEYSVYYSNF